MNMPYRDRTLLLGVVGGLEVLAGLGLCALGGLVAFVMLMVPEAKVAAGSPAFALMAAAIYPVLGAIAIVIGAGLLACRRWARALSLIAAWGLAVTGLLGCLAYALLGPRMFAEMQGQMPGSPLSPMIMTAASIAACAFLFLLPGGLMAWALGSEDARLTCEWRDRKIRWTDRCPLPVLALALLHAYAAGALALYAFFMPLVVGGRIVTGPPATAVYLLLAFVLGVLSVHAYRLRPWAWWGTIALYALGSLNGVLIMRGDTISRLYASMGMPEEQVRMTLSMIMAGPLWLVMTLCLAAFAAWLLLIRKHFFRTEPQAAA